MNEYGFHKVQASSFEIALGNPKENAIRMIKIIREAIQNKVELLVFPELSLTGYTCGDIFRRGSFIQEVVSGLKDLEIELCSSYCAGIIVCVGAPLIIDEGLYNCAVYMQGGKILGVVPKTYLPNYNEFYEQRWFSSGKDCKAKAIKLLDDTVPVSSDLIIRAEDGNMVIGTEICEDLWVASARSERLCQMGANIIVNPSASTEVLGKSAYRRDLVRMQSARCICSYIYASSGVGESSTDLIFSGHCIVADNGKIIGEGRNTNVIGIIDTCKCISDRVKFNSFSWGSLISEAKIVYAGRIYYNFDRNLLPDHIDRYPFVPSDNSQLEERCKEVLNLQTSGLIQRLKSAGIENVVLGLSGGLDSTLALLVCIEAFKKLGLDTKNIHCISMPCFGTSNKTKGIAECLANACGVDFEVIDIKDACSQHLKAIGHVEDVYDIAYENVQARERTQILFDKANMLNALVIGTGDMSELALGWCTYNGDHMSNYAVNCGVPKTLVRFIVSTYASMCEQGVSEVLLKVCDLPVTPELLPLNDDGSVAQETEKSIGKYDLHDFFLYHFVRNGFSSKKIVAMAVKAFAGVVSEDEVKQTYEVFLNRFRTQQFKRSCIPDGVKVGSVSLSPRGDWRMPSDLSKLV